MNSSLLMIVLAYAFIVALLTLLMIASKMSFLYKFPLVILAGIFMLVSYQGWKDAQGWPSQNILPAKFLLHASVIEEPDETRGKEGKIYIWLTDLNDHRPAPEPHAYVVPYDQDIHSGLEDALRNMRNGNIQIGSKKTADFLDQPARDFNRLGEQRTILEFSDIPDPALPEK